MTAARSHRAARALAHLPENDPALAALALWCEVRDSDGPMRTQGHVILVGTGFTSLPLREQIGLLGHHVLHAALRHGPRMAAQRGRDGADFSADAFNLAADALVNEILTEAGLALPRPAVRLAALLERVDMPPEDRALGRWDVERIYQFLRSLESEGRDKVAEYARENAFEQDLDDTEAEAGAGEAQDAGAWRSHLARALQTAGAAGRGVGRILRGFAELPLSHTPWERHLRALLAKAVTPPPQPSYRRPRRAWIAAEAEARRHGGPTPVFQPALRDRLDKPRIVLGLDTSGSITERQLSKLAGEVAAIARRTGAEVHLISFDEAAYDVRKLAAGDERRLLSLMTPRRDGGTSFVDAIREAVRLDPSILVMLTDLAGEAGSAPAFPVLWATPQAFPPDPPFGRVLSLAE